MEKKEISLPWLKTKDGEKVPTFEAILNIAECLEDIAQELNIFRKTSGRDLSEVRKRITKLEDNTKSKSSIQQDKKKGREMADNAFIEKDEQSSKKLNEIETRIEELELIQKMFDRDITDLKEKLEKSIDLLYKIQETLPKTVTTTSSVSTETGEKEIQEQILLLENQMAQLQKNQLETLRYTKAAVEGIKRLLEHH